MPRAVLVATLALLSLAAAEFTGSLVAGTPQTFPVDADALLTMPPTAIVSALASLEVADDADSVDLVLRSSAEDLSELRSAPVTVSDSVHSQTCVYNTAAATGSCAARAENGTTFSATLTGEVSSFSLNATLERLDMELGVAVEGTVTPGAEFVRYIDLSSFRDDILEDHIPVVIFLDVTGGDDLECDENPDDCTAGRITVGAGLCPTPTRFDDITSASFSTTAVVGLTHHQLQDMFDAGLSTLWIMVDMPLSVANYHPTCGTVKEVTLSWEQGVRSGTYVGPLLFALFYSCAPVLIVFILTKRSINAAHKRIEESTKGAMPATNTIAPESTVDDAPLVAPKDGEDEGAKDGVEEAKAEGEAKEGEAPAAASGFGGQGGEVAVTVDEGQSGAEAGAGVGAVGEDDEDDEDDEVSALAQRETSVAKLVEEKEEAVTALLQRRLRNFWSLLFIAGFYFAVPSAIITGYGLLVQNVTRSSDFCFFNEKCFRPWGYLRASNAFFSNLPYVILGFGVLGIQHLRVSLREAATRHGNHCHGTSYENNDKFGLAKMSSLRASGSVSLVYIGVFSALYHVCPSELAFILDSSFMIAFAIMMWLSLYAARHRFTPNAAWVIMNVGLMLFANTAGTVLLRINRESANVFWFIVALLLALVFILHGGTVWYRRTMKPDDKTPFLVSVAWIPAMYRQLKNSEVKWKEIRKIVLQRKSDLILFIVQLVIGFAITASTATKLADVNNPINGDTFSKFLMFQCSAALFFTTYIYYVIMKLLHRRNLKKHPQLDEYEVTSTGDSKPTKMYLSNAERISCQSWVYLALGLGSFLAGSVFFIWLDVSQKVLPAAGSRELGKKCSLFDYFDNHDVWHLLSAYGIAATLMFVETLDEPLWSVPRDIILKHPSARF